MVDDNQVIQSNIAFYDNLYQVRSPIKYLLHSFVSFDQQSKSKPNWIYLKPYISSLNKPTILDFGSGWGSLLLKMPKRSNLYCYDISHTAMLMTRSVQNLLKRNIHFAEYADNSITPTALDAITCSHVIEHVEDDEQLLHSFRDALSSSGILLLNVPINEVWVDPKHARSYTEESICELVSQSGFKVLEVKKLDRWTGFLLFHEMILQAAKIKRLLLRALRFILAILPYKLITMMEYFVPAKYLEQQLIVIAQKCE